jgi:hypothetical protein
VGIKNKTANKITLGQKEGLARRHSECALAKNARIVHSLREADESGQRMPSVLRESGTIVLNLFNHCIKNLFKL